MLQRLNDGEGYELYLQSTCGLGSKLAGKRFRATRSSPTRTATQAQCTIAPPFAATILLDPWIEPLLLTHPNSVNIVAPLYVMNPEPFAG
ncbi:hypothetical protein K437DRAFT_267531 [Tilletiaria anomala UBC 951]|uniref:Uncharacterized protein n=1 Tax=Tilletiaria anomala (strain ATCC 24038 / CBS 436.72 / UBC 951) TaxID=1037660 RepID=A0A066W588_TILAU|nr:uncharacterized protein K437DRAFT_267531 [Tilletiaria anomala UBC 951]KDN48871.1 hypothetical protein K437DRAFT_267531 [Tilletiaria anomala UBC 951]